MTTKIVIPVREPFELLESDARTASVVTDEQVNTGFRGVMIVIRVTAVSDTPSVVPTLRFRDPITEAVVNMLANSALVGMGIAVMVIHPQAVVAAGVTSVVRMTLPKYWELSLVHADGDSITYQVSATYMG